MKQGLDKTSWEDVSHKAYPAFSGTATADVVVIGGGMAGVLSAYLLAQTGKKVVLLEKGTLGSGMTVCTTAFLTLSIDTDTTDLIEFWGQPGAKMILSSHQFAIELIHNIVKSEKIDCDFVRCPNYVYTDNKKDLKILAQEAQALMNAGVNIRLSETGDDLGIPNEGYIEIKDQAKFHPMKFLLALAEKAKGAGAEIYENTEVESLETLEGDRQRVIMKNGSIEADHVIVTTYKPFNNPLNLYFKKGSYVSYVVEMEVKGMKLKEGTYEDTDNPYHYFRVDETKDGYRVIAGGEDHRQEIPIDEEKCFGALIEYMDTIIPPENRTITKKWSGIILEPVDGLPSIGPISEEHVYYALGFSGNGMTYSAITAMIFRDMIMGNDNSWIPLYHPRRHMGVKKLATKAKDYGEELIRGAVKNIIKPKKKPKKYG